jgi:hypothetical protein
MRVVRSSGGVVAQQVQLEFAQTHIQLLEISTESDRGPALLVALVILGAWRPQSSRFVGGDWKIVQREAAPALSTTRPERVQNKDSGR